jgi:hypothetical protein
MKILIACEFSGVTRDAFIRCGHDAISCDLEPSEKPGPHIQGDVLGLIDESWDMMIAFPPCTYICRSSSQYWGEDGWWDRQQDALQFVWDLMHAPIPKIAIENPPGLIGTQIRKADQYIQPWQFGHGETKQTGLWLNGLPKLQPTDIVEGRVARVHRMRPGPNRGRERSRTYPGIAQAMAEQWGSE